ncbi:hypothetical protein V1264_020910 [Littorina saxatilis]|uniref:Uncharacterized protein n=1 Tax=Littorina saxatilis TaxID=31220 RepID=A0AAN9BDK6_9CAEN
MTRKKGQKRRQNNSSDKSSPGVGGSTTDSEKASKKKARVFEAGSPIDIPVFETDSDEFDMSDTNKRDKQVSLSEVGGAAVTSLDAHSRTVSNEDLLNEICSNRKVMESMKDTLDQLRGEVFELKTENDKLQKEVSESKKREEHMKSELGETRTLAHHTEERLNELDLYVRRNNLRIYGLSEGVESGGLNGGSSPSEQTRQGNGSGSGRQGNRDGQQLPEQQSECEKKVLALFNNKLSVKVSPEDIEAVHRLGRLQRDRSTPRGTIVRFVSRRIRDQILFNRRGLKGSGVVIVEDLTQTTQYLFHKVKEDAICEKAWTKNGKVIMKTKKGKVVYIRSLSELNDPTRRQSEWSSHASER